MKKTKSPGDNISLKTKKNEDPLVMAWLNAQTNLMDSIRYLVENEIRQNGVRNLQTYIPMERSGLHEASQQIAVAAEAAAVAEVAQIGQAAPTSYSEPEPEVEEFDDEDIEAWS
ncbi:hypothetical protein J19TS2_17270 [Cohnella xylanilytica]|uniref:Uncharacterized protein n=1 Tax=Cohnella xylanilytica TaxID=557555 RepID=A0A841TVX8_9BACL|nr:hypothetical protein [Cohnella xylanilytica]MBB6690030.1 hypothetical protein [Cohnella xylanilytica]GIO12172.1 hypothetical protein J19TS2_17270 [Cohnella xylanilytica]